MLNHLIRCMYYILRQNLPTGVEGFPATARCEQLTCAMTRFWTILLPVAVAAPAVAICLNSLFAYLLLRARILIRTSNMKYSRRYLAAYVRKLHRKACCTCNTIIFPHSTDQVIDTRGEGKRKRYCFFFSSHHECSRARRKKTPMTVAIPPVVQAIERQETLEKTRFFSEAQKNYTSQD